jgi:cellulose synthase/poly-beta-1,6-N-acetylglucosamine synthase-like glycosyltransferase
MALPVIIFLIIVYFYGLVIFIFYIEMEKDPVIPGDFLGNPRPVSVIVPFRNEVENLPCLLNDLAEQTYPDSNWEVIFVDDHSEDGSVLKLESFMKSGITGGKDFSCLSLPSGRSGKKAALSLGIKHAKNDWIIQLDADCRVGSRYIASHISFLEKNPSDLVAGGVTTWRGKGSFLEIFERLDILSLVGCSAGSFNLGRPVMCSGANLAYSRKLYMETRSFDPGTVMASGDDMFLMIGARKLGKTLSYTVSRESMVMTGPSANLRTFIAQRIRWGSKTTRYSMADIQLLALLVSIANFFILLLPLFILIFTGWWPWLAGGWFFKTLADFMLLYRITGLTGQRSDLRFYIPVTMVYYPVFLVALAGAIFMKPVWKGVVRSAFVAV